jgi:hypothetical protein
VAAAADDLAISHASFCINRQLRPDSPLLARLDRRGRVIIGAEESANVTSVRVRGIDLRRGAPEWQMRNPGPLAGAILHEGPDHDRREDGDDKIWSGASVRLHRGARVEFLAVARGGHSGGVAVAVAGKQTPGSTSDPGALRDDCSSAPLDVVAVRSPCRQRFTPVEPAMRTRPPPEPRPKGPFVRMRLSKTVPPRCHRRNRQRLLLCSRCVGWVTGGAAGARLPAASLGR